MPMYSQKIDIPACINSQEYLCLFMNKFQALFFRNKNDLINVRIETAAAYLFIIIELHSVLWPLCGLGFYDIT